MAQVGRAIVAAAVIAFGLGVSLEACSTAPSVTSTSTGTTTSTSLAPTTSSSTSATTTDPSQPKPLVGTSLHATICPTSSTCFVLGYRRGADDTEYALFGTSTNGGTTWHETFSLGHAIDHYKDAYLDGFSCPSASDCTVVGATNGVTLNRSPLIVTTRDGGSTWSEQLLGDDIGAVLDSVSCASTSDCWAVGSELKASSTVALIYTTTNGGVAWKAQTAPNTVGALNSVSCLRNWKQPWRPASCWAAGLNSSTDAIVITTTDAGVTWKLQAQPSPNVVRSLNGITCSLPPLGTNSFFCVATGAGVIPPYKDEKPTGTSPGILLITTDGGTLWHVLMIKHVAQVDRGVPVPYVVDLNAASCGPSGADNSHCWAVGSWGDICSGTCAVYPVIVTTANYGATWTDENPGKGFTGEEEPLWSISCSNSNLCLANSRRTIIRTTNGGAIWTRVLLNSNVGWS